mgnify:FL=1
MNLNLDREVLDNTCIILKSLGKKENTTSYLTVFIVVDFDEFERELSTILNDILDEDFTLEKDADFYYIKSNKEDFIIANYDLGIVYC